MHLFRRTLPVSHHSILCTTLCSLLLLSSVIFPGIIIIPLLRNCHDGLRWTQFVGSVPQWCRDSLHHAADNLALPLQVCCPYRDTGYRLLIIGIGPYSSWLSSKWYSVFNVTLSCKEIESFLRLPVAVRSCSRMLFSMFLWSRWSYIRPWSDASSDVDCNCHRDVQRHFVFPFQPYAQLVLALILQTAACSTAFSVVYLFFRPIIWAAQGSPFSRHRQWCSGSRASLLQCIVSSTLDFVSGFRCGLAMFAFFSLLKAWRLCSLLHRCKLSCISLSAL